MKWPGLKIFLLPIFLLIVFSMAYDIFLEPLYYDYKQHQIERRMVRNYQLNKAGFDDLRNYVQELKDRGLIASPLTYSATYCSIPPAYYYFEHTIGPDGPIFFGFGGAPADSIQAKLAAIDCEYIDMNGSLRITYRGHELDGFRYFFPEEDHHIDPNWLKLEDKIYYGLDMFGLCCGPWYWAIDT